MPGWEGVAVIGRRAAPWSIEAGATIDVDGLVDAPAVDAWISRAAPVRAASAILRSPTPSGLATMMLDGEIEALETDAVPGRARLVR